MGIPENINLNHLAIAFLLLGLFLFITGLKIIRIEKISVASGFRTWGLGLFMMIFGSVVFAYNAKTSSPDLKNIVSSTTKDDVVTPTSRNNSMQLASNTNSNSQQLDNTSLIKVSNTTSSTACIIDGESQSKLDKGKALSKKSKYQEAIDYLSTIRDSTQKECVKAKSQIYIGDAYKKLKQLKEARIQLQEAKKYFKNHPNYKSNYGIALKSLGEVEIRAKDYTKACSYLYQAKEVFRSLQNTKGIDSTQKPMKKAGCGV